MRVPLLLPWSVRDRGQVPVAVQPTLEVPRERQGRGLAPRPQQPACGTVGSVQGAPHVVPHLARVFKHQRRLVVLAVPTPVLVPRPHGRGHDRGSVVPSVQQALAVPFALPDLKRWFVGAELHGGLVFLAVQTAFHVPQGRLGRRVRGLVAVPVQTPAPEPEHASRRGGFRGQVVLGVAVLQAVAVPALGFAHDKRGAVVPVKFAAHVPKRVAVDGFGGQVSVPVLLAPRVPAGVVPGGVVHGRSVLTVQEPVTVPAFLPRREVVHGRSVLTVQEPVTVPAFLPRREVVHGRSVLTVQEPVTVPERASARGGFGWQVPLSVLHAVPIPALLPRREVVHGWSVFTVQKPLGGHVHNRPVGASEIRDREHSRAGADSFFDDHGGAYVLIVDPVDNVFGVDLDTKHRPVAFHCMICMAYRC